MYKVDIENKRLTELSKATFGSLGLKERFDIQEWIEKTPGILGEPLLIIAKEYELPTRSRLDLLAIDKNASLVVIELKRDDSGSSVDWQSIKYASYCSNFTYDEIINIYAEYLGTNEDEAELQVENFIDEETEKLNDQQRIILASKDFHSDVVSAVMWLRDFSVEIQCVKLEPYVDENSNLYINPSIIIPLPEAKDYIKRRETKNKEKSLPKQSSFSLEKSNLNSDELKNELVTSFNRASELTPRVRAFFELLLSENRAFDREEVKQRLLDSGIGDNIGHAGRLLSNISQFLTKKSNPHLRQVIEFSSGGTHGETKNDYQLVPEYRDIIREALDYRDNET